MIFPLLSLKWKRTEIDLVMVQTLLSPGAQNPPQILSKTVAWSNFLRMSLKIVFTSFRKAKHWEILKQQRENHKLQV